MKTLIYDHEDCTRHLVPDGHPERPQRHEVVRKLIGEEFAHLDAIEAPLANDEDILLAHSERYLGKLTGAAPGEGFTYLDGDTMLSPGTMDAARRAAGAAVAAVDMVLGKKADNAFVAMRPPGHHAERETPMGFCFFSNAAIAAKRAVAKHGLARVAVVDFDVHHGNGTQDVFWDDPNLLFCSSHQMPLFPGTGYPSERGEGNIRNEPLKAGDGPKEMLGAWKDRLLPALRDEKPELIVISAGFDAHRADPLANINMEAEHFGELTRMILDLADATAGGRVVSLLEGGYDLDGLRDSVRAHLRALSGAGA